MSQTPIWSERDQPALKIIDRHIDIQDYSEPIEPFPPSAQEFVDLVNKHKQPLNDAFRSRHQKTLDRLSTKGIDLSQINYLVSQVLAVPVYPDYRVVTHEDLINNPAYSNAAAEGFFPPEMVFNAGQNDLFGEFSYILNFVRLNQNFVEQDHKINVADTLAHELSHAANGSVVSVYYKETPEKEISWRSLKAVFGYRWRHNGEWIGGVLDEASAAKVASIVRKEQGLTNQGDHPLIDQYREGDKRLSYVAIGALALDLINQAAGYKTEPFIYRPLWQFAANQEEAAREELAAIINFSSQGDLTLEQLETVNFLEVGDSLAMLSKIEEKCGVEPSQRPTRHLSAKDINI